MVVQGGRPRHPLTTVHKHPPTLLPNILKVVKHVIQNTSNVLRGTILQPQSPINKISLKVLRTHKPHTIQDMSYPIMLLVMTALHSYFGFFSVLELKLLDS